MMRRIDEQHPIENITGTYFFFPPPELHCACVLVTGGTHLFVCIELFVRLVPQPGEMQRENIFSIRKQPYSNNEDTHLKYSHILK